MSFPTINFQVRLLLVSRYLRYAWKPGGGSPKIAPSCETCEVGFFGPARSLAPFAPRSPRENSREFPIVGLPIPTPTPIRNALEIWEMVFFDVLGRLCPGSRGPREKSPIQESGSCHQGLSRGPYNS